MKYPSIILLLISVLIFTHCKKDDDVVYNLSDLLIYNVQASAYFHVIFREAESAWAFIDEKKYSTEEFSFSGDGSSVKKISLSESGGTYTLNITYNNWKTGPFNITGEMMITLPDKDLYQIEGKTANINLTGFSIHNQTVVGSAKFTYKKVEGDAADYYDYTLTGGGIYMVNSDNDDETHITAATTNGVYRCESRGNVSGEDNNDVWSFSAKITGDIEGITYTNTINQAVTFTRDCLKPYGGTATFEAKDHPSTEFSYGADCGSDIEYRPITDAGKI